MRSRRRFVAASFVLSAALAVPSLAATGSRAAVPPERANPAAEGGLRICTGWSSPGLPIRQDGTPTVAHNLCGEVNRHIVRMEVRDLPPSGREINNDSSGGSRADPG